jgi:hypothetical protein
MSNAYPEEFKIFLAEVPNHAPKNVETTIFSVGGRGYYENPTSDLLAFFMNPHREHGLGSIFLDSFLYCLESSSGGTDNISLGSIVEVSREVPVEGGRVDLLLQGDAAVLLIENKIYHHADSNPFDKYKEYGQRLLGKRLYLALLSPQGNDGPCEWKGISYRSYCTELEKRLADFPMDKKLQKWWILAADFVLHIRNTLYPSITMTPDQIKFAEDNAHHLEEAMRIRNEYRRFLMERTKGLLEQLFPQHLFRANDDGWGIRGQTDAWGRSDIVWTSKVMQQDVDYGVNVYLCNINEDQKKLADEKFALAGMLPPWTERHHGSRYDGWRIRTIQHNREESEKDFVRLAIILNEILGSPCGVPSNHSANGNR